MRRSILPVLLTCACLATFSGRIASSTAAPPESASDTRTAAETEPPAQDEQRSVSFYRHVRPIIQRHCSGCHQPAKSGGELLLTSFDDLKRGGTQGAAFLAGKPDESLLIEYVTGDPPLMPLDAEPLSAEQVATLTKWIAEGARDDTPAAAIDPVDADHPPVYDAPPVITALAYSPDGKLLAVSGYHEVLLHRTADGDGEPVARLVGRGQRIESLAFSPDGKSLAAVGGTPALFGEVQLWNVETRAPREARTFAHDTLFGVSFSDDGKLLAFGAADNRARVVDAESLEPIMRLDTHSDWVFGTTFSLKNDHLITVSRDMSMKLTIVENGQFVDNITSITPGALKGGLTAVQRHPTKEEVLTGGHDGMPKLYRIFRTQARRIGDDFNRIRSYPTMPGRIFDLRFDKEGTRFVAGSSTATAGAARIYETESGKQLFDLAGIEGPIFAVAFHPQGAQVAVAGFEGRVRIYDANTGEPVRDFIPVEIAAER
ncbi:MAG: c-type cytochrome domain-containing protein [Planctomycetaceae bacterium]